MSNSKDYYKARFGQTGFDPTEIEEQSIFDARAMDFGAPFESTAVSRKQVREENEKGIKEKQTIVGQDGSTTENSIFTPHIKAGTDGGDTKWTGWGGGISEKGMELVLQNKRERREAAAKKEEIERATAILNQLDAEKDDSYFYNPNDPNSSQYRWGDVFKGSGLLGAENPTQTLVTDGGETMEANIAAGEAAREAVLKKNNMASRHPEVNETNSLFRDSRIFGDWLDKENWSGLLESIRPSTYFGDETLASGYPEEKGRPPRSGDPAVGSGVPALRGEGLAESIFEQGAGGMDYAQMSGDPAIGSGVPADRGEELAEKIFKEDGVHGLPPEDREKIDEMWTRKEIEADETIIKSVPAAFKSVQQLEKELKELENNPEQRREKYLEFLRENGVLKEWRPDLFKALAGTAFRLLMGDSLGDAFTYSFGRLQEKKDLAEATAAELKLEEEKNKKAAKSPWDKTPQMFNIGTDIEPIRVTGTQLENGNWLISMPDGEQKEVFGNQMRDDGTPILRKWYTQQEITERVQANSDRLTSNLASIINQYENEHDLKDKQIEKLNSNLIAKAEVENLIIDAMYTKGISFGPNMGLSTEGLMSGAIRDLIDYRMGGGVTKTLSNIFDDTLIKADMSSEGLDESTWILPDKEFINREGKTKDVGKMPDKAFADTLKAVENYIQQLIDSNEIPDIEKITTNRQMFRLAEGRFEQWQEDTPQEDIDAIHDVGLSRGYTPFMYWLISGAASKY